MDKIKLLVNEQEYEIDANYEKETLLYVLREVLGLTGTKKGCGTNDCGACWVLVERICKIDLKTQDGILSLGTAVMLAPLMPEGTAIYEDL